MHSGNKSDRDDASNCWREALLELLLESVRFRDAVYFQPQLQAPWGFRLEVHGAALHIVVQGCCWLEVTGSSNRIELTSGDLVVVPRGNPHVLFDSPAGPIVDFFDMIKRNPPNDRRIFHGGGNGTVTKLISSTMQFESVATAALVALLPSFIQVKSKNAQLPPSVQATIGQILRELAAYSTGTQVVLTRLVDILFIQAMRTYFEQNLATVQRGWSTAMRDPQVAQALALLHAHPLEPWTVASLARRVASSRSLFAEKFAQVIGDSPLHYLKRLRLNAAAVRLQSTNEKLAAIAADAGYESAAAFTRAFKKYFGKTPGEYRRVL